MESSPPPSPERWSRHSPAALYSVLPMGDTISQHEIEIAASRERVWGALLEADLAGSWATKALLFLRGYGRRAWSASRKGTLPERLRRFGFVQLIEITHHELVFALIGRFWHPLGDLQPFSTWVEFRDFAKPGYAKAAWNLKIDEVEPGRSILSTQTRVETLGTDAYRSFRRYWRFIKPFSGLLRLGLLSGVKRRAEYRAR